VDSVGACVGMKGMRVQSIIRELRGEKIDIIEYSEDPVVFATHALSPAKISRVSIIDPIEKHMEVIVDDSQLSLAIGKKGQNVRLAAKLLGWKIDIKSEEEKRQEVESQMAALVAPGAPVSQLIDYGLPEVLAEKLVEVGVGTIEKLGAMTPEQLEEIEGIGPKMVERIQDAVNTYYSQFEAQEEGAAAAQPAIEESQVPVPEPEAADMRVPAEQLAEFEGVAEGELHQDIAEAPEAAAETVDTAAAPAEVTAAPEGEENFEPGSAESESATIKDSGLQTDRAEQEEREG